MKKVRIYYHYKCGASNQLKVGLSKLVNIYSEDIEFINIEEYPDESMEEGIKATPTTIFYNSDGSTNTFIGYESSFLTTIKLFLEKNTLKLKEVLH